PGLQLFLSLNGICAFLQSGLKKLHAKCTDRYAFFCMNISEFVLVHQQETWEGALEYCRKQYNDLASLSSPNMMDSALGQSTQAETEYVWTGLRFLAGEWFWVNGHDLDYTAWYQKVLPQCPARDLHCGALDMKTMLWTHRNCEEKFHFLCQ
uniref:C-type lectin domain-containing protein n=1 Tax=Cyprinus carpio TaxID=7962 RepID=A0A8C1T1U3_CYPCA